MKLEDQDNLTFVGVADETASVEVLSNNTVHQVTYVLDNVKPPKVLHKNKVLEFDLLSPKRELTLFLHYTPVGEGVPEYTVNISRVTNVDDDDDIYRESFPQDFGVPIIENIYTFFV